MGALIASCSLSVQAATYINSGSDSDYVFCGFNNQDGSSHFGNCPKTGRGFEYSEVRPGVIKLRFTQDNTVYPWIYAKKIKANTYREIATLPDSETHAIDYVFSGDYMSMIEFVKANPTDKGDYVKETFFKVSE